MRASRSNRDIAREVGCDHKTVAEFRRELEHSAEIPHYEASGGKTKGAGFGGAGNTHGTPRPAGPQYDKEELRAEIERLRRAALPPVVFVLPACPPVDVGLTCDRLHRAMVIAVAVGRLDKTGRKPPPAPEGHCPRLPGLRRVCLRL